MAITGGTVGFVHGGYTRSGVAGGDSADAGNKVTISGGTIDGAVYGGQGGTEASNNTSIS